MKRFLSLQGVLIALTVLAMSVSPLRADDELSSDDQGLAQNLDELVERYCKANGGRDRITGIRSIRVEATLTMGDGKSGELIYIKQKPDFSRSTWYGPNGVIVYKGYNGKESWEEVCMPDGRVQYSFVKKDPKNIFEWIIVEPEKYGATLEMLPTERKDRADLYHVRAHYEDGMTKDLWIDSKSFCEVRVVTKSADGEVSESVVEKFTRFDGLWFPKYQKNILPDGSVGSTLEVNKAQTNMGLLHCFFDPPAELVLFKQQKEAENLKKAEEKAKQEAEAADSDKAAQ